MDDEVTKMEIRKKKNHGQKEKTRRRRTYSRLTWGVYQAKDPIKFNGVSTPLEYREQLGLHGLVPAAFRKSSILVLASFFRNLANILCSQRLSLRQFLWNSKWNAA